MPRLCPPGKLDRALDHFEDDPEEGLEEVERLADKYAKDPDVRYALGAAYLDLDRPFDALEHLEWSEGKESLPHVRRALVDTYLRLTMVAHAERVARRAPGLAAVAEAAEADDGAAADGLSMKDRLAFERARVATLHCDASAINDMQRLSERLPEYAPARNVIATGHFVHGDFDRYREATRESLRHAPDNVYSLLNAVRLALLEEGIEGARAYRRRAVHARDSASELTGSELVTLAHVLALMDDAEAAEDLLGDWTERGSEAYAVGEDVASADQLEEYLDAREEDPRAPLFRLHDFLPGFLRRWLEISAEDPYEHVGRALGDLPGVVSLLPRAIAYENPTLAEFLARAVLSGQAPPAPDGRPWPEVLRAVVEHGPGHRDARLRIFTTMGDLGLVADDETVDFQGTTSGVTLHNLELFDEPIPSGLPEEDDERFREAMESLVGGGIDHAGSELAQLHERHPDAVAVHFNLALAEHLLGGEAAERSRERMERIVHEHPAYLFARAHLGVEAIESGDLERARALLALPAGEKRFHVRAYTTLIGAQGRLALALGDVEAAEGALASIEALESDDVPPYRMLEDAIDAYYLGETLPEKTAEGHPYGEDDEDVPSWADDEYLAGLDDDLLAELDDEPIEATTAAPGEEYEEYEEYEEPEPPSRADLAGLVEVPETWHVAHGPLAFVGGVYEPVELTYGGIVVQEDGMVRHVTMSARPFGGRALYGLVASACAMPEAPVPACRPTTVVVADAQCALALSLALSGTPIEVRAGDVGAAQEVFDFMASQMHPDAPPAFLSEHDGSAVDAFLDAADSFFEAAPWDVFDGDEFLAFRIGDGPWRYAGVMGQNGEEFGLTITESWAAAQALLDPSGPVPADGGDAGESAASTLEAIGAIESVSLAPLSYIAPVDAACYVERDVEPYLEDEYPVILRFATGGDERPHLALPAYTALLRGVARRARRARTRVRAFEEELETDAGVLSVRFPAEGDEGGDEIAG